MQAILRNSKAPFLYIFPNTEKDIRETVCPGEYRRGPVETALTCCGLGWNKQVLSLSRMQFRIAQHKPGSALEV